MTYARAYRKVFPHRQQRLRTASTQAHLLVERYIREHAEDLQEMLQLHGLGEDRLAKELDLRLKAKTLREMVTSEVIKGRAQDDGESARRPYVLIKRETVEVEDNTTRMHATELLADIHGVRKLAPGGGAQQNVAVIYVMGGKIKKKRQERIASSAD